MTPETAREPGKLRSRAAQELASELSNLLVELVDSAVRQIIARQSFPSSPDVASPPARRTPEMRNSPLFEHAVGPRRDLGLRVALLSIAGLVVALGISEEHVVALRSGESVRWAPELRTVSP